MSETSLFELAALIKAAKSDPSAPQVASVRVEAKMKPRNRGYRVVQKVIGAV